jgi:hypothetical protein
LVWEVERVERREERGSKVEMRRRARCERVGQRRT